MILCLFMLSLTGFSQTNFSVFLANGANPSTTTFEVDIMLTVVSPAAGVRLSGVTTGVNFNFSALNGGTPCTTAGCGTWLYVGGKSPALNALLTTNNTYRLPSGVATWGHLRTVMSNLAAASSIDIPPGTYTIGRYRFTNSVPFAENSNANLWLNPVNNNPTGSTNTIVSFYPFGLQTPLAAYTTTAPAGGAGLTLTHTAAATFSLPLNTSSCFTAGSQTATTAPSCLGNSNGSSTITMSPTPASTAITYTVDGGASTPGTLVGSAFTVSGLSAGPHTIVVTGSGTCTTPITVTGVTVPAGSDPGPPPTVACYETATLNSTTCMWVVTGTQPTPPTVACYQTATFNNTTCMWDVTGTQPPAPTVACYETATFNGTTCQWVVTGTQPAPPTLLCYQTLGSFNNTTCMWEVTGTQPPAPTVACYQTATFNNTTCMWDVTGTQPVAPTVACYETATFNNTTCMWDVTGTQPPAPTVACYETATFNNTTCQWVVAGTQPAPPTLLCYQTLGSFNNTTCQWTVTGTQPTAPTVACYETATFNNTTCQWDVTGTQPAPPTLLCYQTLGTFNNTTCQWNVTGTQPAPPTLLCYQTLGTFNNTTCMWDVTGTQPAPPTLLCYQTLGTFNNTTCQWTVTGTQPAPPTLLCYQTLGTFNNTTCMWDVTGTQPAPPTLLCYQTLGTFNNTTCQWTVTGTQPAPPTLLCYQTLGTFNNTTCQWTVTGTQPPAPTVACYQTATFNNTTCTWVVTGTQPTAPTVACYQIATFNNTICQWVVTGTQPTAPTVACYQTTTFNNTTCQWVVTGTQPAPPTLLCYQTLGSFNNTTCQWTVTGTQPAPPTLLCYQTLGSFNNTTCQWTVTGTQPTLGSVTTTAVGSYLWPLPYGTGLTYTSNQTNLQNLVGCNLATLNLTIVSTVVTVPTFTVGSSCGATISGLNVTINTPAVSGAISYTFRLTNLDTAAPSQLIVRPVNSFALSNFAGITLGTNYQIEVQVNAGPFGPPCLVKTPAPTSSIGAQCGTTLTSMSQYVYCTAVSSVTGYRFRVTNLTTNAVAIVDSSLNRFSFSQVPLPIRAFGTTYSVEVSLRNTDGSYLPYSLGCNISTRAFPTTTITAAQCGLTTPTSNTTNLEALIVAGATEYRFRLSNVTQPYSATITKFINKVALAEFVGLLPGTTYTVEVALKIDGTFGPYGAACNVTTIGLTKTATAISNDFTAIAYPNPFASDFMFNVKTSSESAIQIRVYDMLGKQIDNRNLEVSDIENLQVGANYPSGVYNVIVSQGENTQTLRVIKR